ncbi:fungal hydrophobin [Trametes versicolor FP-101664 SS1]|uniref:fungal hydrophobin n=1 Tax=Trametes versicolor (strain FP-101664) TaxID=717944 RepID=UPI0004623D4C|nr:fungal hydrophobin [Trametes versicolor FP-101664 SS1]EIW55699.1 fungal hydrophobin [Trametes versicolor FP-101664 SS1]
MIARVATAIVALAAATAVGATAVIPRSTCSTGEIKCCNSVQQANSPSAAALLGLLGVVVQGVDVLVGLTCDPISVVGAGGNSCSANTVCCENNSYGGLISIGCVPVTL